MGRVPFRCGTANSSNSGRLGVGGVKMRCATQSSPARAGVAPEASEGEGEISFRIWIGAGPLWR
jgi:hypothetical protein